MEQDPLSPSQPKMISLLSSNFIPKLDDHDYMELVWENGQIRTRGLRSSDYNRGSTQNPRLTTLFDFYDTHEYDQVLEQNIGNGSDKNLGDTQVVPMRQNPASKAKSPPCPDGVLPEESDKSKKEKTESMFFKPQAVAVAADNKDVAMEVEPKTDPGLPEHQLLENLKESDVSKNKKGVESMLIQTANGLRAMNQNKTVEFSPPDAESVAMGSSGEMVGMGEGEEEKNSFDFLGWSTELCSESLSTCSPVTSEDPITSLMRSYVESEGSTYTSSNTNDRSEDVRVQVRARRRKTCKRIRSADFDDLSARERRREINKRMRALQNLLPNSNKEDKASMLDEAIKYMTSLQVQLHTMSVRNGFVAPSMMVPWAHYSLVGMGMDMTPHFLPSLVPGAALHQHGISDAVHMPGFPNQPGLDPMSHSSFSDQTEVSSHQSAPAPSDPEASSSSSDDTVNRSRQGTVDRPSENLLMPEFSQVKKENPEHLDGQAGK